MGSYPSAAAPSAHVRRVVQARLIKSFTLLRFVNFHIYCSDGEGVRWDVRFVTQLFSLQRHVVACVVHVWLVIVYG